MITTGQVPVGTSATLVCRVPSGACTTILTGGTAGTVFYGNGTAVGTANGAPLFGGTVATPAVVTIPGYPGSSGTPIYAISSGGTVNIGFVLSTGS